jgi:hypothetical protein
VQKGSSPTRASLLARRTLPWALRALHRQRSPNTCTDRDARKLVDHAMHAHWLDVLMLQASEGMWTLN